MGCCPHRNYRLVLAGPNQSFKVTAHRGARSKRHFIVLCPLPAVGGTLTQALGPMNRDSIAEVEIDGAGRLHIVPSTHSFPYIYREGIEVNWSESRRSLHSPKPKEWSYSRWFEQILTAARAQGCELHVAADTRWLNIDPGTKADLLQAAGIGP